MKPTLTLTEWRDKMLAAEGLLEAAGQAICSADCSVNSWNAINDALSSIREAIRNDHLINWKED